ncbi:MAG: TetR/AcrR family transcriptional regulator [Sterolibacteriaceae bacterium]|nr:TetR/AcrR family transcriptional regulator [Sterolibacteriaceae bacterium]
MTRPSQNIDQRLLEAGRRLLPDLGCAALSVRRLAAEAGVNAGMFHYHFRTKDVFLQALLQSTYDDMFARLQPAASAESSSVTENLRRALNIIARFVRDNRRLMLRLLTDAVSGEKLAADFLRANMPRHIAVVAELMDTARHQGRLAAIAPEQMIGFTIGAIGMPIIVGAAFETGQLPPMPALAHFASETLSDDAIAQRIDLALAALSVAIHDDSAAGSRGSASAGK